jgi:hypothetical protein
MGRTVKDMTIKDVDSISRGVAAITIHGRVATGPAGAVDRRAGFHLSDNSLAFILSTLAGMPAYRDVFRAIADEIDLRRVTGENKATAPVTRRQMELDSADSMQAFTLVTRNAIERYWADQRQKQLQKERAAEIECAESYDET